jgi:hypothetical protein
VKALTVFAGVYCLFASLKPRVRPFVCASICTAATPALIMADNCEDYLSAGVLSSDLAGFDPAREYFFSVIMREKMCM